MLFGGCVFSKGQGRIQMGKIIAVTNQKGGVGKTTTCINLCCGLTMAGKKVLLCDMDPQGNCTSGFGVDKNKANPNIYNVLIGGVNAKSAVVSTKYGDILPSNKILAGAGVELVGFENREYVLKNALEALKEEYDYIYIDCPPSLEMLTLNALCACDAVFIPVQCEYFALEGLSDLMTTIRMVKKRLNPHLEIEGVLLTMYDSRTNFSAQVLNTDSRHRSAIVKDSGFTLRGWEDAGSSGDHDCNDVVFGLHAEL